MSSWEEREGKRMKDECLKEFAKLTYALAKSVEETDYYSWAIDPFPGEENPYLGRVFIKKEEK